MKRMIVGFIELIAVVYLRYVPIKYGKLAVWNRIIMRHFSWRNDESTAKTFFGAELTGSRRDFIHLYLKVFGVWEPSVTRYFQDTLRHGDVAIDVGANVGVHTLLFSHLVGPTGIVHAIEASPSIFKRLEANLAANHVGNVVAYNVAVVDVPGDVTVFLHDESNLGGTTIVQAEAGRRGAHSEAVVRGQRLADIVPTEDLRRARLIKIDVEGAEWPVLMGLKDALPSLAENCDVLVEVTASALADFGASVSDVVALFAEYGFIAWRIPNEYRVEPYFERRPPAPEPLVSTDVELADLLFRRAPRGAASA